MSIKARVVIRRGLRIPLAGAPAQQIDEARPVSRAGLVALDYHGIKPGMKVSVGDEVALGQTLFVHKDFPAVRYVSPAAGVVEAVNRGARRALQSVVVRCEGERSIALEQVAPERLDEMPRDALVARLCEGGLWPALRTRPYSKTPDPESAPAAIFVTAIDTRPLAADPAPIIAAARGDFECGVRALLRLTDGRVHVCAAPDAAAPLPASERAGVAEFAGPHPAGLAGTHIHFLDPVAGDKTVWTINYRDVIGIGESLRTGVFPTRRVVALAGPTVARPRLVATRAGACLGELCAGELTDPDSRVISGSALDGRRARDATDFLGPFDGQVTALAERGKRYTLGWIRPGLDLFSACNVLFSAFSRKARQLSCMTNGSPRALVPIGVYERVFPLELMPTQLLKALLVSDTETAQTLGCLELDEEDLALCSFVCPSKHEFGPVLRRNLERIEREG